MSDNDAGGSMPFFLYDEGSGKSRIKTAFGDDKTGEDRLAIELDRIVTEEWFDYKDKPVASRALGRLADAVRRACAKDGSLNPANMSFYAVMTVLYHWLPWGREVTGHKIASALWCRLKGRMQGAGITAEHAQLLAKPFPYPDLEQESFRWAQIYDAWIGVLGEEERDRTVGTAIADLERVSVDFWKFAGISKGPGDFMVERTIPPNLSADTDLMSLKPRPITDPVMLRYIREDWLRKAEARLSQYDVEHPLPGHDLWQVTTKRLAMRTHLFLPYCMAYGPLPEEKK